MRTTSSSERIKPSQLENVYLYYIDLKMEELIKEKKPIKIGNPEYWKAWDKNQHEIAKSPHQ
ncbi:hypothetical protein OC683_01650 ['Crotalaria aegyptiaca' phytoplasma]|uniref:Uncharacterized protein n=1 Tax=Candidatus Phytoplasma crotalariae TaxID=2982627 RepID=A0ABT9D3C1_9MOLU|nr:hypothetical protein ['Crotalaria aegyptiaca' phytoplasma]MDO8059312.1 hypothetical protein ['Crotalaria aegyptiaca' phytoplasma]